MRTHQRRCTMATFDRVIQYMQSQQGQRVVLENEQQAMIYRPGGAAAPMTKDPLTLTYVLNLVNEILPDELRTNFASGEPVLFPYKYGSGSVEVAVAHLETGVRVSIGVADAPIKPLSQVQIVTELPEEGIVAPAGVISFFLLVALL